MSFLVALLGQTWRNLRTTWANQLFTFLAVSISILLFTFFTLLYLNIARSGQTLGHELRLTLYFEGELVPPLQEQLKHRITDFATVDKIVYVSRKEAYARLSRQLGREGDILAGMDSSFLPSALEIYPRKDLQSLARINTFAEYLKTLPGVQKVQYGQDWLRRLSALTNLIRIILLVSGSLVILTTIFMISQTIRLTLVARREELEILRLLGAGRSYVQGPLILEGLLQGLLGSSFGIFLLFLLFEWTTSRFRVSGLLGAYELTFLPPPLLIAVVAAGTLLCLMGCLLSTRRFLRI